MQVGYVEASRATTTLPSRWTAAGSTVRSGREAAIRKRAELRAFRVNSPLRMRMERTGIEPVTSGERAGVTLAVSEF